MTYRQQAAEQTRTLAARAAAAYPAPAHHSNNDERRHHDAAGKATYVGNFTKCLPHDEHGFLQDPADYEDFVKAIDSGDARDFAALRMGPGPFTVDGAITRVKDPVTNVVEPVFAWAATHPLGAPGIRAWESQGAGLNFSLEGCDPQSVTMPPAPALDSQELISEMAENYWMALCRDVPFADWATSSTITQARSSLARFWWFRGDRTDRLGESTDVLATSRQRRRVYTDDGIGTGGVELDTVFRGVTHGERVGPYVSQFMLIGTRGINGRDQHHELKDGRISYGAVRIDQRVRHATAENYLTDWPTFLDVQNGAALGGRESLESTRPYRFIASPRDLATYVHYDALYEAYLNACVIMLGLGTPTDPGLPFRKADWIDKQTGFAQFGGPHILTLVTEVATRALKAVRFQKFNVHRRLRPEAVGGWLYQHRNNPGVVAGRLDAVDNLEAAFAGTSGLGAELDAANGTNNWLLPMAFTEGSPAHPAYGAGHATVAGACVTVLKAWFDTGAPLLHPGTTNPIAYEADADGSALHDVSASLGGRPLTVEGELNKVGANVAIGRNWAGVHYYSDYLESFRLGEQIAVRLLEEQRTTYGENFSMSVPLLGGTTVRI